MSEFSAVVVDTNVLVSALLQPRSSSARAVSMVLDGLKVFYSEATLDELRLVLGRKKFDRYLTQEERRSFLSDYLLAAIPVINVHTVSECRDPNDDKFLELALSGEADLILSGDGDLPSLHPWRSVSILSPAQYLAL